MKLAWLLVDPGLFAEMVLDWVYGRELKGFLGDVKV
jgi:hypothetical protein